MNSARGAAKKALQEVLDLLKASQKPDSSVQRNVYQKFEELRTHSEFNQCLAYIFANGSRVDNNTRRQAGLILRGNLADSKVYINMPANVRSQVKETILRSIGDSQKQIRKTVGSILATIAALEECDGWQSLLMMLVQNLDNPNSNVQDGAMLVLEALLEDCRADLEKRYPKDMQRIIAKLVTKVVSPVEEIRRVAISAVTHFVHPTISEVAKPCLDQFHQNLLGLVTKDKSVRVLVAACQAFTALLESCSPTLRRYFKETFTVMTRLLAHEDNLVAYNAANWWCALMSADNPKKDWFASGNSSTLVRGALGNALKSQLKGLVPMLLKGMAYSQDELAAMGTDEKDAHVPDRQQDVFPRHACSERKGFTAKSMESTQDQGDPQWSLRKSCAQSLDNLSHIVGADLLPVLLPLINKLLNHEDWSRRESAILALGAVAGGCSAGIEKNLEQIFTYLLNLSRDQRALIRRIACWTLSRYAEYFIKADDKKYLQPLIICLLERMVDGNKKVQKAACSAMVQIQDLSAPSSKAAAFLDPILTKLVLCLGKYQQANMHTLYDCIAAVAKASGGRIGQSKYLEVLVPKLLRQWSTMESGNYGMFPLLECLSSVALASGKGFQPYAKVIFPQCIKLIQANLKTLKEQRKLGEEKLKWDSKKSNGYQRFEGADSIICCVELAGCIYRSCGHLSHQLADPAAILRTLFECMNDENPNIRQSAMAWLGDITCVAPHFIGSYFPDIVRAILRNLDPRYPCVCSNAAWAVGEAAVRLGPRGIRPFAEAIMRKLIPVIVNPRLDPNLLHNVAITISRMGLVCPDDVCAHLEHFGKSWCQNLVGIDQPREAEMAYRGLCNVVSKRPQAMLSAGIFMALCDTIASYSTPSQELHRIMKNLLHSFRAMLHNRWSELFGHCNPELRYHLACVYDLH